MEEVKLTQKFNEGQNYSNSFSIKGKFDPFAG